MLTPLTEDDLQTLGSTLFSNAATVVSNCVLFGLYLLMLAIVISIVVKKGMEGRTHQILFACMMFSFLCNAWNFGFQIYGIIVEMKNTFMVPLGGPTQVNSPLGDVVDIKSSGEPLGGDLDKNIDDMNHALGAVFVTQTIPFNLNLVIGDGIVAWRASVIWSEKRGVKYWFMILMAANFATNIADIIQDALGSGNTMIPMDYISSAVSLAVNILATGLIAWKAREHRQTVKTLRMTQKGTAVERVLLLLVESGFVFCAIQIVYTILQIFVLKPTFAISVWTACFTEVANATAVLYPMTIFIVVNTQIALFDQTFYGDAHYTTGRSPPARPEMPSVATSQTLQDDVSIEMTRRFPPKKVSYKRNSEDAVFLGEVVDHTRFDA